MRNSLFLSAILLAMSISFAANAQESTGPFTLEPLPYAYNALEPYFDAQTMELHHDKHLATYVTNLNAAVKGTTADTMSLEELMANISKYDIKVRNNGGGVYNHNLFFSQFAPNRGGAPVGSITPAINAVFGNYENMKNQMNAAAMGRFGSGWAWLILTPEKKLAVCSTPNQDNPLMDVADVKGTPILAIDVWEHAYYLKYQNRRAEYLEAFWKLVNWQEVMKRYDAAMRK
jgi:Fe-Mn family superoxide dismutase